MNKFHRPGPGTQRGAAALLVVLLLFFIISLVAAYAGRNLIFEQKTSANQYRATQAFEAAEAGLEWAVAMLNGGRVTAGCIPPVPMDVAQKSFRERYLEPPDASGNFEPNKWADGITAERPSCVHNGAGWNCSCPAGVAPTPAIPAGGGIHPGFRVCFEAVDPPQPGVVRVVSTGRTSFVDRPCEERGEGTAGEAAATVSVVVALSSALATPPSAALTVRGDMNVNSAIQLSNTDKATNGITANVGGVATAPSAVLITLPGTPGEASIIDRGNDASLSALSAPQMFTSLFRMAKETYRQQPAAVRLSDCAVACSDKLMDALQANPGRMLWVDGDMTIESNVNLGCADNAAKPVLIVSTGNINLDAASVQLCGLLYSQAANWTNNGLGVVSVRGAAVAEGGLSGNGTPSIEYVPTILNRLRLNAGSFVRVPGSWRDFP